MSLKKQNLLENESWRSQLILNSLPCTLLPVPAPPRPSSQVFPTEVCRTSTTIQIRFRKNYFSEKNGQIIYYTVIVAEDDSKNSSGLEMPSWRDVQAYSVWPPYQVESPPVFIQCYHDFIKIIRFAYAEKTYRISSAWEIFTWISYPKYFCWKILPHLKFKPHIYILFIMYL